MSAEKLLKELGLNEDLAASLTDENLSTAKDAIIESVKAKLFESEDFFNSLPEDKLPKEVLKAKFNEGVMKIAGMSKKAIDQHFSLTEEDKVGFTDDEKKEIHKYIAKATAIYKQKTGTVGNDIAKLQDENLQLKQQLESRSTEIQSLNEKFESDLKEKLTAKETETLSMIEASHLQQNVPVAIGLIWDKVFVGVKNKYTVMVENGVTSLRKKDNPQFKVEKADKSGHMELKDALIDELKAIGAWKDAAQSPGAHARVPITPDGKNRGMTDAIKKKIEEEKDFYK
jgi:hypothetical protein